MPTIKETIEALKTAAMMSPLGMDTVLTLCEEDRPYEDFVDIGIDVDNDGGVVLLSLHKLSDGVSTLPDRFVITLEVAQKLTWGTYGPSPDGNPFNIMVGEMKVVRLGDCDTEHLQNILRTQHQISPVYDLAIRLILDDRGEPHQREVTKG